MAIINDRAILNVINDAIFIVDLATGNVVDFNDRMCEMYHCTPEQVRNNPPEHFSLEIPPYTTVELKARGRKAMTEGPQTFEWQTRRFTGEPFWMELAMRLVEIDGQPRLLAVAKEITAQKENEIAVQLSAMRLETLSQLTQMTAATRQEILNFALESVLKLTQSPLGYIATMDETQSVLTIVAWSQSAMENCRMADKPIVYSLNEAGLWGEAVRQRRPVITNDYQAPNPSKKGLPEGHLPITRHLSLPVFDGERVALVAGIGNKTLPYDENDVYQIAMLMNWVWQILQRKESETQRQELIGTLEQRVVERTFALGEAQQMIETVVETMPLRLFWKDKNLNFLGCNTLFVRDAGFETPEQIIGKSDFDMVWNDRAKIYRADDRSVMKSGVAKLGYEEAQTRENGSQTWLRTSKVPLRDGSGKVIGILGLYEDITDRKQMELERERLQQEIIEAQQRAIKDLSTPIIPIMDQVIVMPLIGAIDSLRARELTRTLLKGIGDYRAQVVILDITGVPLIDSGVAAYLNKTIQAIRLKGARAILVGISDAVAETIVEQGLDWSGIETLRDLQSGLITALESLGIQLVRKA